MISSMSVPICNHFHVRRAYSGKITSFRMGAPLSPFHSWGPPSRSGMIFYHKVLQTRSRLSYDKTFNSLSHSGLLVPGRDGQTDGQTDRITVANTRYSYASFRA